MPTSSESSEPRTTRSRAPSAVLQGYNGFQKPSELPPEKRLKVRQNKRGAPPSLPPTINTLVWNGSFGEILNSLNARLPSSAFKGSTVSEMVSSKDRIIAIQLGEIAPVEPELNKFREECWARMFDFLMNPLPAIVLKEKAEEENISNDGNGSRLMLELIQVEKQKKESMLDAQKERVKDSQQVVVALDKTHARGTNASAAVLKKTHDKLLAGNRRCLEAYRKQGILSRRACESLFEILETGKVPENYLQTIEPAAIKIFINQLGILQERRIGNNPPVLVLSTFST